MAVYWAAQPGAGTEAGARHAAGGRQVQSSAGPCRPGDSISLQHKRLCQLLAREPGSAVARAGRAEAREPTAGEGSCRLPGLGLPSTPASWGSRGPSLGQGCWSWGSPGGSRLGGESQGGKEGGPWRPASISQVRRQRSREGSRHGHGAAWTPRPRSGFPRPRCPPSTRLACPHPRVRPGCPALSCFQSHMPGAVLGPSWPLASPFPGCHSQPALAAPRALLTAPPPPLLQRRPHVLLETTGTVAVCVCTGWGPPRPRWSHEPAGEGQLLKQRLLRRPQSTAENHSPPWQGPCKGPEEQDPPPRPRAPCTWRSPGTCHLLRLPTVPLPQPGPSSKPENHREPPLVCASLPAGQACPLPSEGMLSTRKGRAGRGAEVAPQCPSRHRPKRVTEAQPTWAPFRAVPASAPAREPPAPACLLCGLTRLPVPAPHLCACHLLPRVPPRRPSNASLMGDPIRRASCRPGPLGSISLLVKWGYSQLAPPSWLSAS